MKKIAYVNQPCERCGSKRKISRTWKEVMPTISGKKTTVEFSQIICTNKTCQAAFTKKLNEEHKKKEEIKRKKDERDAERKANSLLRSKKTNNKSRI